ncbi:MAG: carbon-nitrogen hydrolase family protein [Nitrospinota bacterium]|nr:carbon-nitrogen hydrolase family protein [Nitrospinota bacterium]
MDRKIIVAAIQAAPVIFNRDASCEKAVDLIKKAGAMGARLAVFGETWLPGYPWFNVAWADTLGQEAAVEYLATGVTIPGPCVDALCDAAREAGTDVVIGVAELDSMSGGTIYCTLLFIGSEGKVLGKHRKTKPTATERIMWGEGDGKSIRAYQRPYGKLSGLNCWEHQMVLPGYALMMQGTQFHASVWPGGEPYTRQTFLTQAFCSQAACYGIMAGGLIREQDIPERYKKMLPLRAVPRTGDSAIIGPKGNIIAGPLHGEEGILTAEASMSEIRSAKAWLDVCGHYSRPDIFELKMHGRSMNLGLEEPGFNEPGRDV